MEEVSSFFDEITRLVMELERQYGVATARYTSYAMERLLLPAQSFIVL